METAEIKALAGLLDELDYYTLLEAKRDCSTSELKEAYYQLSRRFHPDANRSQPAEVRGAAERIAKRLTEAWSVLRDPRRRRAYDEKLRRDVAIKLLHRSPDGGDETQLLHEARASSALNHPGICTVHEVDSDGGQSFIVMEFCEGISVADAISGRGRLPEAEVRKVLGQLSMAMSHAHAAGVIHRDIKPSNVMVTRDGAVKLMDFGLAGRLDDGSAAERLLGTPKYMAPEQMTGGAVGRHTDVFALGHLAYEMLSGELLFKGDDFWALRKEVIRCRLPAFSRTLPGVSSELRRVLRQMLNREPEERSFDHERVGSWAAAVDYAALAGARARP